MEYGNVYWCTKQAYSIVLQGVVDFEMLFTSVHCGDPGSFHDTRVLRWSDLFSLAENHLEDMFPNGTFLLGDKGYYGVGTKWIVTPFKDFGNLIAEQTDFNVGLEQAFGLLKSRFRYLGSTKRLRDVGFAARLVVACCVLHNICIRSGDNGGDLIENAGNPDHGNEEERNDLEEIKMKIRGMEGTMASICICMTVMKIKI